MRPPLSPDGVTADAGDLEMPLLTTSSEPLASRNGARPSRVAVLLALGVMITGTVVQSEASQALQGRAHFNKPFFITCFNHTLVAVLLPLVALYDNLVHPSASSHWRSLTTVLRRRSVLPLPTLVSIALFVSVFSLIADYFWYAALTGVSVTAANAISNCSPLFVYCFSICFLRERLDVRRVGGVLLGFVGVTCIVFYQNAATDWRLVDLGTVREESVLAGLLVVVSSVFYAAFQVALKVFVGEDLTDTATVLLLAALSGVFTIPLWVVGSVVVAHNPIASLREPFGWPQTSEGVELLVGSGVLSVLVNVSMPLMLCWTTPLETSVGGMLVVPLAGVWDVVFHHTRFSSGCIVSSVLVLIGFAVLEYKPTESKHANQSDELTEDEASSASGDEDVGKQHLSCPDTISVHKQTISSVR